ncbi:Lrp/AsnC family transcriptional regulator [Roseospirillum parvum]|uniref:DNA-binding transcriptional regulator, Lrp family n=1 Tax=Roseospirillum parvum TaxID=83401 RepID=A0A1G7ZY00_9PROT|nr:Lrp/AsnC family transcriptional regulator [Roseospirillum parvum]SDH13523.1 DNA-binding transcriptional regulator, Lrp family [Roseospirillum parvum]
MPTPPARLDQIDRRLLGLLQSDGRMTNAALAEAVGLSASACHRRVARLEAAGIIEGYGARLDPARLGRPTSVFVEVRLTSQHESVLDAFEAAVLDGPEVIECYLMGGEADYQLRIAVADMADYERLHRQFLARLPGVATLRSSFAIRTVCRRTQMAIPETS